MKHAVYVYEHEHKPGRWIGRIPGGRPKRYAFGDHGGWKTKLIGLTGRGLRIVATGREGCAMAVHLAPK